MREKALILGKRLFVKRRDILFCRKNLPNTIAISDQTLRHWFLQKEFIGQSSKQQKLAKNCHQKKSELRLLKK
ncbi:MAG: hypothetical protein AAFQ89_21585, partial [Cyanobacteria bacterium J06626_18]